MKTMIDKLTIGPISALIQLAGDVKAQDIFPLNLLPRKRERREVDDIC